MTQVTERSKTTDRILEIEKEIQAKKKELSKLRSEVESTEIENYILDSYHSGKKTLSELFGNKNEMILVFNMGRSCPYCTLWADGYNGLTGHLENRAAFVVISPDPIDIQKEFATSRNWKFQLYSHHDSTMSYDLGMSTKDKGHEPAIAALSKDENGKIILHSSSYFGPGDNYCVMWDFLDMLPKGSNHWAPKYSY